MKKTIDFYLNKRIIINCIILLCLFFVQCFWFPMIYIIYPVLTIMLMADTLNNGFTYLMFTIPFCYIGGKIGFSIYLIVCILFLIKYYIITICKDKIKVSPSVLIVFVLFLLYSILPIGPYNYNFLVKLVFLSLIIFTVWVLVNQRRVINFSHNIRILSMSLMISCLFSLTYYISPYLQEAFHMNYLTDSIIRFQALLGHPNAFGTLCSLCISFLAYSYMKRRRYYDLILTILIAFLGIFSFSKTYLIILFIVGCVLTIYLFRHNIKLALALTIVMLVSIGGLIILFPDVYTIFYDRFLGKLATCKDFRDIMNMITTDRFNLWLEYGQYLIKNPIHAIFGGGLGVEVMSTLSAHNAYISMIYQLGLIGSILFVCTIVFIVRDKLIKNQIKIHPAIWLPIIIIALILSIEDVMFYIM